MSNFIDNLVSNLDKDTDEDEKLKESESTKRGDALDEDLSETNFYVELSKPGFFFVVSLFCLFVNI